VTFESVTNKGERTTANDLLQEIL